MGIPGSPVICKLLNRFKDIKHIIIFELININKLLKLLKLCNAFADAFYMAEWSNPMGDVIQKNYFGTFEVARICQVSPASVSRWIKNGTVKASQTVGGHKRLSRNELVRLLHELKLPIPAELERGSGIKVLIIDDEPIMRKVINLSLSEYFSELAIDEAEDGFQAGMKLMAVLPDLVTLDLGLPGIDGFQICKMIRASKELAHTKILVISGQREKQIQDRVFKAGANAFLEKPVQKSALKETILEMFEVDK